jgi:hypothetical protein
MAKRIVIFADGTGNALRRDPVFIQPPHRARLIAEFTADNSGDPFRNVDDTVNVCWLGGGYDLSYHNDKGTASIWLQQTPLPEKPLE